MATPQSDRGAAAVEFALILPVLLVIVLGMFEFSRAYNAQISISGAAREGARVMAIEEDADFAKAEALEAAPSVALDADDMSIEQVTNGSACQWVFTIEHGFTLLSDGFGSWGPSITLSGVGAMQCGG